ncbi:zinc finger protein 431-like [Paramacrobiotus metropolitanus]|uniref:zinc finger protein 431-like n=1 Tax=Paramacrobiotus metropolitanus TaxID=2943436 RepID=UPI0024465B2A|nr:zinc finger protein 431-like [Paramacrobiotus metropolitanus]
MPTSTGRLKWPDVIELSSGRRVLCERWTTGAASLKRLWDLSCACFLCPKKFSQANVLKAHINAHLGRRDYVCPVCSKAFVQSAHLRTHQNTHLKNKNHQCSQCLSKFSSKAARDRHEHRHTGVKPYPCQFCQKSFSRRESQIQHRCLQRRNIGSTARKRTKSKNRRSFLQSNSGGVRCHTAAVGCQIKTEIEPGDPEMPGPLPVVCPPEDDQANEAVIANPVKQEEEEVTTEYDENVTEQVLNGLIKQEQNDFEPFEAGDPMDFVWDEQGFLNMLDLLY